MEKDLIEFIAKSLVDDPSAVSVNETEGEKGMVLQLKVADNDIGKVIGKYGRIAKAMRTVLSASAVKDGKRYSLDILDIIHRSSCPSLSSIWSLNPFANSSPFPLSRCACCCATATTPSGITSRNT